jgi:multidrug efflux pump subunit AcrA (membrane-fusion protein)
MFRQTRWLFVAGIALLALGPAGACRRGGSPGAVTQASYYCPMHPSFVADSPGQCSICGMNLVPRAEASASPAASFADESGTDTPDAEAAARRPAARSLTGRSSVSLPPESRRLLGVRSEVLRRMRLFRRIHAVGRLTNAGRRGADDRRLWAVVELYENDLPAVVTGMEAGLTVLYLPGKAWTGRVAAIAPAVGDRTRTIAVRVEVEDAAHELKPGMYADVFLKRDLGMGVMAPEGAVIYSGNRRLVFVEHDDGTLEPREVRLGPNVGEGFQVLGGLAEGERVVTSANFLIDSEASLRAAVASLASASGPRGDAGSVAREER